MHSSGVKGGIDVPASTLSSSTEHQAIGLDSAPVIYRPLAEHDAALGVRDDGLSASILSAPTVWWRKRDFPQTVVPARDGSFASSRSSAADRDRGRRQPWIVYNV